MSKVSAEATTSGTRPEGHVSNPSPKGSVLKVSVEEPTSGIGPEGHVPNPELNRSQSRHWSHPSVPTNFFGIESSGFHFETWPEGHVPDVDAEATTFETTGSGSGTEPRRFGFETWPEGHVPDEIPKVLAELIRSEQLDLNTISPKLDQLSLNKIWSIRKLSVGRLAGLLDAYLSNFFKRDQSIIEQQLESGLGELSIVNFDRFTIEKGQHIYTEGGTYSVCATRDEAIEEIIRYNQKSGQPYTPELIREILSSQSLIHFNDGRLVFSIDSIKRNHDRVYIGRDREDFDKPKKV